jgi:hypothetical protein
MWDAKSLTHRTGLSPRGLFRTFLLRELPYIVMLVLALVGIAYTDLLPRVSIWYWQVLAVAFGVICIMTEWPRTPAEGRARLHLIVRQTLHWG